MTIGEDAVNDLQHVLDDVLGTRAQRRVVAEVIAAIENEGRAPAYHQMIMARHRREWPTLWKALDALRDNYHGRERS